MFLAPFVPEPSTAPPSTSRPLSMVSPPAAQTHPQVSALKQTSPSPVTPSSRLSFSPFPFVHSAFLPSFQGHCSHSVAVTSLIYLQHLPRLLPAWLQDALSVGLLQTCGGPSSVWLASLASLDPLTLLLGPLAPPSSLLLVPGSTSTTNASPAGSWWARTHLLAV